MTGTAVVVLHRMPTLVRWQVVHQALIPTSPKDGADHVRQDIIVRNVLAIILKYMARGTILVGMEEFAKGRTSGKQLTRAEISGTIKFFVTCVLQHTLYMVSPLSLKKFMGSGKFDKADMSSAALQRFGFNEVNDNIVDAFCVARYTIAKLGGSLGPFEKLQPVADDLGVHIDVQIIASAAE